MTRAAYIGCCALWLLLLVSGPLMANNLLMVRSQLPFAPAQSKLEEAIQTQGYFVSQGQRVDISVTVIGFAMDDHRAISYGKPEEVKELSDRYPELTPFLPLQVVIFAEENTSLLVALSPLYLKQLFPQPELSDVFDRWNLDLERILEIVRDAPPSR